MIGKKPEEDLITYFSAIKLKYIPDIIESKLTRHGTHSELCYREYFTYLPKEYQDYVIPLTIGLLKKFSKRLGNQTTQMRLIEQGVELVLIDSPNATAFGLIVELLAFGAKSKDEAESCFKEVLKAVDATYTNKLIYEWNDDVKVETEKHIEALKNVMNQRGVNTVEELLSSISDTVFDDIIRNLEANK